MLKMNLWSDRPGTADFYMRRIKKWIHCAQMCLARVEVNLWCIFKSKLIAKKMLNFKETAFKNVSDRLKSDTLLETCAEGE